jgi:hypothetical protein
MLDMYSDKLRYALGTAMGCLLRSPAIRQAFKALSPLAGKAVLLKAAKAQIAAGG